MATVVDTPVLGFKVEVTPLPFEHSQPMIPTMIQIISIASKDLASLLASGRVNLKGDLSDPAVMAAIFPSLQNLGEFLDGKLEKLSTKLMMTTRVAADNAAGSLEWFEMSKPADRAYVFDQHPQLFLPLLIHTGRVSFARFFPAIGRRESAPPAST